MLPADVGARVGGKAGVETVGPSFEPGNIFKLNIRGVIVCV